MMFIGNLNYVGIAIIGGLRVASGSMGLGDVQAFIQYSNVQPTTHGNSINDECVAIRSGICRARV